MYLPTNHYKYRIKIVFKIRWCFFTMLQLFQQASIFGITSISDKDHHRTRTSPHGFHRKQSMFSQSKTPLWSSKAHCTSQILGTLNLWPGAQAQHIGGVSVPAMTPDQDSPFLMCEEQHTHGTIDTHDMCILGNRNTFAVERKAVVGRQTEYYS